MAAATFVIFGASGDLTRRKLIPALYRLFRKGRLGGKANGAATIDALHIVGFSRTSYSDQAWRELLGESTRQFAPDAFEDDAWQQFAESLHYHPGDIGKPADFESLAERLDRMDGPGGQRLYYLSTAPRFYEPAVEHLGLAGLADDAQAARRIIVEKPFGVDLATARQLNAAIHRVFREDQVYRIDHYLGKETVQNLLVLRFANAIFEPLWNRNFIDHVQITVAEEVDVGSRADYYDSAGVIRDMVQNHLLQLLMITAMESPVRYDADSVRNEKVKVLHAIRPLDREAVFASTFRGQYRGYAAAPDVPNTTRTATFAALRFDIDNWRWQGVPFYLRSGKAMSCRTTQIVIQFREPPHKLFQDCPQAVCQGNRLVIQVQPAEGIQLHFQTKVPDAGMLLRQTDLDFNFQQEFRSTLPEAYERLLQDAWEGDASLFARADEVEAAWRLCDPILQTWEACDQPTLFMYDPGNWGPAECGQWLANQHRTWFDACPVLH